MGHWFPWRYHYIHNHYVAKPLCFTGQVNINTFYSQPSIIYCNIIKYFVLKSIVSGTFMGTRRGGGGATYPIFISLYILALFTSVGYSWILYKIKSLYNTFIRAFTIVDTSHPWCIANCRKHEFHCIPRTNVRTGDTMV